VQFDQFLDDGHGNRGKFPGERRWIYAGAWRMGLARGGMLGPGMARRSPMKSSNDNFNFMRVLASPYYPESQIPDTRFFEYPLHPQ
jgi:hypothetical protein